MPSGIYLCLLGEPMLNGAGENDRQKDASIKRYGLSFRKLQEVVGKYCSKIS